MRVSPDFICEHGEAQPWATCVECMALPRDVRPERSVEPASVPTTTRTLGRRLPESPDDPIPPLVGNKDVSVPVHDFVRHVTGENSDWLFAGGGFPHHLRNGGWVYLRCDGQLGWRARVRGIGYREVRVNHTGEPPSDQGPGATIELIASTWERVDHDLGELAEKQIQGYRYLYTGRDGELRHVGADAPEPDDLDIDPPYSEQNGGA